MITYSIYIIDDEEVARDGITQAIKDNYSITGFDTAEKALESMSKNIPDLALLDIGLPGISGIDALKLIKNRYPDVVVIMITAYEDIATVISAMKHGAYDYIVKPIHIDTLIITINNALETIRLRKEVRYLQEKYLSENIPCFIGESKSIQNVMDFVDMVAKSPDTPILIHGETGTGKELIASAIHYKSPNFKGPFVTLNCAAIPKELVESELFGYEKGAFSGAGESGKKGLVEEAAEGTLFLDEIGDLNNEAQAKLLRFLEDGEYYRVGGTKKLKVNTRIVSATNRDLETLVKDGLFREDLYYRIAVIKVDIPSLNKRTDDILPIASHFLFEFSRKFKKSFKGISAETSKRLLNYDWKGNIRELKNLIERGALTGKGPELEPEDIGLNIDDSDKTLSDAAHLPEITENGIDLISTLDSIEKQYLEKALAHAEGNESKAAKLLNMNYYTFRHRKKRLIS